MLTLEEIFPPFALRISCGPVTLRESGYVVGNDASAGVGRKVGYVDNGRRRIVQRTRHGKVGVDEQRVVVTPSTYVRPADPVVVEGADGVSHFLGIDPNR